MGKSSKKQRQYGFFRMIGHVTGLALRKSPGMFLLFFILLSGAGLCTAGNVFFKRNFFDAVEALARGEGRIGRAMVSGVVMAVFLVLTLAIQAVSGFAQDNFSMKLKGHLGRLLNEKASRIDPVVYEDNRFLDHINKAYTGLEAVINVVFNTLSIGFMETAYFVSMGAYFFSLRPALLLMFAVSFIPILVSSSVRRRMYANLENRSAPYRRKYEYFEKCICAREYAKETRLWRAEAFFKRLYQGNLDRYTDLQWKTARRLGLVELGLRSLLLTGYIGTIVLLFYYVFRGEISVGAFAAVFSSLDQMFGRMEIVFNGRIGSITQSFGAAQNYYAFLNLPEREGRDGEALKHERIELKDVSFAYPGSDKNALNHINLVVHKGETVAIVGVNGSGKSTLTRLLMGLYMPTSGELLLDGRDVREIAPGALYRGVSAVFQRYQSYKMTVAENIRLSDAERQADVEAVLEKADFSLDDGKFTEGTKTMLGKDFGGIDLSGGQWQRLAIARGLYRDHDMIVLDEPTAAIDPLEEAAIYRKFAEISRDKTAFIVTHRLGSAKIADRIIVMDGGRIVETGTHEELIDMGGRYSEMYEAQAKWYA